MINPVLESTKYAQLFVADLFQTFHGKGIGNLKNIDKLTACADYKLPWVLQKLGILSYSPALMKKVSISCFGGDGSYDEIALWNQLRYNGIEPIIKPDKNAVVPSGSRERDKNVEERNLLGYDLWAREHGYGHRWPATEGIFSAVKRIFGEQIHARSETGMIQEASIKFWAYQKMKRYGEV